MSHQIGITCRTHNVFGRALKIDDLRSLRAQRAVFHVQPTVNNGNGSSMVDQV